MAVGTDSSLVIDALGVEFLAANGVDLQFAWPQIGRIDYTTTGPSTSASPSTSARGPSTPGSSRPADGPGCGSGSRTCR
ncbi:hypothetical protein LRE75_36620 [Streptomyces sp. 372A]